MAPARSPQLRNKLRAKRRCTTTWSAAGVRVHVPSPTQEVVLCLFKMSCNIPQRDRPGEFQSQDEHVQRRKPYLDHHSMVFVVDLPTISVHQHDFGMVCISRCPCGRVLSWRCKFIERSDPLEQVGKTPLFGAWSRCRCSFYTVPHVHSFF